MTILITGYNGYIGSHIYEYLIKNRYKVYGIDYYILDLKNYKKLKKIYYTFAHLIRRFLKVFILFPEYNKKLI